MNTEIAALVAETAKKMRLLDKQGRLRQLDSLSVISFVVALERATKREIPTTSVRQENFASIESVAQMLANCVSTAA